jgi:hypothetical protein
MWGGSIISTLVSVGIGGVIGGFILRLALWPAFSMIGMKKGGRFIGLFGVCCLLAMTWLLGTLAAGEAFSRATTWRHGGGALPARILTSPSMAVAGVLLMALTGATAGMILRRATPMRGLMKATTISGAIVGLLWASAAVWPASWMAPAQLVWVGSWLLLPIAAVYLCALARRREFRRYRAAACVPCGYARAATMATCPECGSAPHHLCHKCRHIVPRQPGEPCPRCKAVIGARCWACGYDLRGVASGRCPECGLWKPVPARSRPEPAGKQEGITSSSPAS